MFFLLWYLLSIQLESLWSISREDGRIYFWWRLQSKSLSRCVWEHKYCPAPEKKIVFLFMLLNSVTCFSVIKITSPTHLAIIGIKDYKCFYTVSNILFHVSPGLRTSPEEICSSGREDSQAHNDTMIHTHSVLLKHLSGCFFFFKSAINWWHL